MESPFPAPGKTIKVKTFLPGAGNEVGISAASSPAGWVACEVAPSPPQEVPITGPSSLTMSVCLIDRVNDRTTNVAQFLAALGGAVLDLFGLGCFQTGRFGKL